MARRTRARAAPVELVARAASASDGSDDDDADVVCVVCAVANSRVTVVCVACAKTFHLACHAPPLRRRPAADASWECVQCRADSMGTHEEAAVEPTALRRGGARTVRGAGAKVKKEDVEEEQAEEEESVVVAKRRRIKVQETETTKLVRKGAKAVEKEETVAEPESMDESDEPLAKAVAAKDKRVAGGGRKPPVAGKGKKKPPARKVQEPELAFKRASRASARAQAAPAKKTVVLVDDNGDEEEEEENVGGDDDGDSDFSGSNASEDDDEDEEDAASASDEDFEPPVRLPTRPKSPQPKKKPTAKKPTTPKAKRPAKKRNQAEQNGDADETVAADEEEAVASVEVSSDSEEEAYYGPSYFVEYAPNARSSCKSCEQKLQRETLRVGVRVRHSMFGITTYFKHVECTQICHPPPGEGENMKEFNTSNTGDVAKPAEILRGLSSLKPKDREFVIAHMKKNAELGLLDERRELSEDEYSRKTRMLEMEPSPYLTASLLPYQREALAWMTAQEQSDYKGGILADEMGMGKTIQAISLILEKPRVDSLPRAALKSAKSKTPTQKVEFTATTRGGTLVVCPLVAVMQWKSEIERFVEKNHFSIYIHHGPKRLDVVEKIAAFDIVLTTYSIIESEVRKTLGWEKVPCKYCKKKYLPDKLILHNKYFCGPNAKKTKLQDRQQTKKSKKKAAGEESDDSDDDVKKPAKGKKPARKTKKKAEVESDDDDDDMDDAPQRKVKGKSPMHQIHWTRIVLDEAHYIKDRRCNTARGVFELKADYRWCLTGTPLQNRIGELFSLVRFLQIKHYAYYHCSKCDCQKLDFDFPGGKCQHCDHIAMHHFSFFNKKIVIPIQSYGYVAEGKVAMLRLQNELLQHILLRRTKEGRADDISLPPKLIRVRRDRLDERENDFYQAIYTQSQAQFNTYVSSGTLLNNYAHIFDLLIRLRQAVDHPYLVIYSKSNPALQIPIHSADTVNFSRPVVEQMPLVSVVDDEDDGEPEDCAICHEDVEDPVKSACDHVFCRECVKEFIESLPVGAAATCPECEKPLTVNLSPPKAAEDDDDEIVDPHKPAIHRALVDLKRYNKHSILHRIPDFDSFQTSTKIEALMQELNYMKARDPSGKAIIFSQFVNMLDIIQHRLTIGGIKCVKLSGNMSMDLRDRTIKAFREDNSISAFLISLKAGGVALNLTIASHIFLMDPWWNPAAENQAIDRTHRLGQFKPVQATRFIIAGTIEERILKLQEKKQLIFEGTVGASVSAICRLTEDDLRFLFSK